MAAVLKHFLREKGLHTLVAWTRYFDVNSDHRVDRAEFRDGLEKLEYDGDAYELFNLIDKDGSGHITLNEIDHISTDVWNTFTAWCGQTFVSAEDMEVRLMTCLGTKARQNMKPSDVQRLFSVLRASGGFTKQNFQDNAPRLGWYGSSEALLFKTLDVRGRGQVSAEDLAWFEKERWRQVRRSQGKGKGKQGPKATSSLISTAVTTTRTKVHAMRSLDAFRASLQRSFGCMYSGWRTLFDRQGSMAIRRKEFFQSCNSLCWYGDVVALWMGVDPDDTGMAGFEKVAPAESRTLALFKVWKEAMFCDTVKMVNAFRAANGMKQKMKTGPLSMCEWAIGCDTFQCPCDPDDIFDLLDWKCQKSLNHADVKFLDSWDLPSEWLVAQPDEGAANVFKEMMMSKYGHAVRGWCKVLDKSNAGRATWTDFKNAADALGFTGNIAGAWLALDSDNSGHITLSEIDAAAAESLARFVCWARDAFGGVVLAVEALDMDGSGCLNQREFRRGLKEHGFSNSDPKELFQSLDFDLSGTICPAEICFLDEWDVAEIFECSDVMEARRVSESNRKSVLKRRAGSIFNKGLASKRASERKGRQIWPRVDIIGRSTEPRTHSGSVPPVVLQPQSQHKHQRAPQPLHKQMLALLGNSKAAASCPARAGAYSCSQAESDEKVSAKPLLGLNLLSFVGMGKSVTPVEDFGDREFLSCGPSSATSSPLPHWRPTSSPTSDRSSPAVLQFGRTLAYSPTSDRSSPVLYRRN